MNEFGKYLREQRKRRNVTLVELSQKTGLSQPYLSQIENGKRDIPKPDLIKKITAVLRVNQLEMLEKAGYISTEERKKEEAERARLFEERIDKADYDILLLLTNINKKAYLNFKELTNNDRGKIINLLKAALPEYFEED